jgi:hypothetical protein
MRRIVKLNSLPSCDENHVRADFEQKGSYIDRGCPGTQYGYFPTFKATQIAVLGTMGNHLAGKRREQRRQMREIHDPGGNYDPPRPCDFTGRCRQVKVFP